MIDIDGKKVIEHIIDLYPKDSDFLFIINDKHAEDTDIINLLENGVDKKNIVVIPRHKKGPVFSIQNFGDYINDEEQVVINYCDFSMYWDYNDFEKYVNDTECDGCVVCLRCCLCLFVFVFQFVHCFLWGVAGCPVQPPRWGAAV